MISKLHLISLDNPDPPDYGGVIDIFYRVKALADLGVGVHLHVFLYGNRPPTPRLESMCEKVYYYPRPKSIRYIFAKDPFIVATRKSPLLLERLGSDPFPILAEGLHSCGFFGHPALASRTKVIRMHNIEWKYYANLARQEKSWLRRSFLQVESRKLKAFERRIIPCSSTILGISRSDVHYFSKQYPQTNVQFLPPFHGHRAINGQLGKGQFALFHGKLAVSDNAQAALFLAKEVFSKLKIPFVIAGKDPSPELLRSLEKFPNVQLHINPDAVQMENLQQDAHLHVLHSNQADGFKIKLLNALFTGRFVLSNPMVVSGTGMEELVTVYSSAQELMQYVQKLWKNPFTQVDKAKRSSYLFPQLDDHKNALRLLNILTL